MARSVGDIMTRNPRTVDAGDSVAEAARQMRDGDFGSVLVLDNGRVDGIVTDRDIAVRAVAEGRDPESTQVSAIYSTGVATVEPSQSIEDAVQTMREHDIRRLPVVENGRPVGILSLGDLVVERDPESVLADISASSPDQ
jgi:CBS domain-containing protein